MKVLDHSCVFFFSSRRRHTRFDCDWSSDVCSSDLIEISLNPELGSIVEREFQRQPEVATLPRSPAIGSLDCGGAGPVARAQAEQAGHRTGERRVGEEGRTRWAPDHLKKKNKGY